MAYLTGVKVGDKLWDLLEQRWRKVRSISMGHPRPIELDSSAHPHALIAPRCMMNGQQTKQQKVPRFMWAPVEIEVPPKPVTVADALTTINATPLGTPMLITRDPSGQWIGSVGYQSITGSASLQDLLISYSKCLQARE